MESIQLNAHIRGIMGKSTTFLAGTMIFWLPILFLTTYTGFYESYELAMENEFLGIDYPDEFATMLIIPTMVPTIFTAHTILNRERKTIKLIEKFNLFHSHAEEGHGIDYEGSMLTDVEYNKLDYADQIEYCRDLRTVGKWTLANRYLKNFYERYHSSKTSLERAAALYAKTLISDGSVDQKEMYESSELAYNLVADHKESKLYPTIVTGHIIELPYLGYEKALQRLREIEMTVDDAYLSIRIETRKLYFLHRMDKIQEIDFDSLEDKIDFTKLNHKQLNQIEDSIARLKNEILHDRREFEELELFLHQRSYRKKWNGSSQDIIELNLGRMYRQSGDYELSMHYFNRALTHAQSHNLEPRLALIEVNMAKTHLLMGNYDEVIKLSEQSYNIHSKMDFARGMIESLTLLVKASEELGLECREESQKLEFLEQQHGITARAN